MVTAAALISILAVHIIPALVLVLLVRSGNSAVGHARSRMRGSRFSAAKAA